MHVELTVTSSTSTVELCIGTPHGDRRAQPEDARRISAARGSLPLNAPLPYRRLLAALRRPCESYLGLLNTDTSSGRPPTSSPMTSRLATMGGTSRSCASFARLPKPSLLVNAAESPISTHRRLRSTSSQLRGGTSVAVAVRMRSLGMCPAMVGVGKADSQGIQPIAAGGGGWPEPAQHPVVRIAHHHRPSRRGRHDCGRPATGEVEHPRDGRDRRLVECRLVPSQLELECRFSHGERRECYDSE